MKPIGYWLNRADHAFTTHMDTMLAEFGLTRITWQVLNVVADTPEATDTDIHTVLAANAARATLDAVIATTLTGDWTTRPGPGRIALTDDGRRRLAVVTDRVAAFRAQSMHGITEDEYRTAVSVLERMTLNVETTAV
ncbi:winged helix-turn-helix transcriptional regulator [Nocardia tengchongensis]|uniref:Winged helix-turn-helix transcriptional regulator n=1 Tax=Nocardia tengchongensis TaxID=2055889 RepID=A0ABX8CU97_9NOCA|nr:MarR family winged helix-turn-helix transcriptional regulator [Nocardia tengchongensis]QVI23481.1 winged helix-turn-helix transcriptional regulator [Nocardia tengchongensis]